MKAIPYLLFVVLFLGGCGEEITQKPIGSKKEKMNAGPLGEMFSIPDLDLTMIWVRPGSFAMGSQPNERSRNDDETPPQVKLTEGFFLGKHELLKQSNPVTKVSAPMILPSSCGWSRRGEPCLRTLETFEPPGRNPDPRVRGPRPRANCFRRT